MHGSYTVDMEDGRQLRISSTELARFQQFYPVMESARPRTSRLFWVDLYVYAELGVNPGAVLREIERLEGGPPGRGTKSAAPFKRSALRGLWHQHFFCGRFVGQNVIDAWNAADREAIVRDAFGDEGSEITEDDVRKLAHRVTHGAIEDRAAAGRLTGEWIIFAKHEGENFYLCLGTHRAGDGALRDRILMHCAPEFPFLTELLAGG